MEEIERRKEKLMGYLKSKKILVSSILFCIAVLIGAFIRTRNLVHLQNKYLSDLDAYLFYRYAEYILEHGKLMVVDMMRYVPLGQETSIVGTGLSYVLVYLYKFIHFFNRSITLMQVDIWYPVIFFCLTMVMFFLLVRLLFNDKVALLATAFLAVVPSFIHRTTAGVSDKEALGMFLAFGSLYFFMIGWRNKNLKFSLLFGFLSGIFCSFLGIVWGGVRFVLLVVSLFSLIMLFFRRFTKEEFYLYASWFITVFIILTQFTTKYMGIKGFLSFFTTSISAIAFIFLLIDFLLFELNLFGLSKIFENKFPRSVVSFCISFLFLSLVSSILFGISFIPKMMGQAFQSFTSYVPTRWILTVAESHQPYFIDLLAEVGWLYILLFLFGSILLFYQFVKPIYKYKWHFTIAYSIFIFCFIFNRYSPSSRFNGANILSMTLYIGSLLFFALFVVGGYIWFFYKDKNSYEIASKLDSRYVFVFIWFLLTLIGSRDALRLMFVFAPVTAVLTAYLIIKLVDYSLALKEKAYKFITLTIILIVIFSPVGFVFGASARYDGLWFKFARNSYSQIKFSGTPYDVQWQAAMDWVKENTPEDAVFAHWWDYGYWVQTGGNRATVLDGGNTILYWDHLLGRHVLLAHSENEALEFLKSHNATHLLIISDEIGKYPAYSSIGADENYDRYSWITTFGLDPSQTQELRNETILVYTGGTVFDEDFVYNDILFPMGVAGIAGFMIPVASNPNDSSSVYLKPGVAVLSYNGKRTDVPIDCIFFNGKLYEFNVPNSLGGCLRIIPTVDGSDNVNPLGAALYISSRVRKTLFAKIYLFDQKFSSFKEVYSDEQKGWSLFLYQGRLIGPLKIWEIKYPEYIRVNPEYLELEFPNELLMKPLKPN